MGARKQKWASEEDAALRAGIAKHGVGSWRLILRDPEFRSILSSRSNVDMKEEYWPPTDFDHILSVKLKDLTTSGKLIEVNQKYRIAPAPGSLYSEGRDPETLLLEDIERELQKIESGDIKTLTKSQVDAELARMITMTTEESASVAARAVAEAETLMAEADAAVREAGAAEADAQDAQAFAEAVRDRSATELGLTSDERSEARRREAWPEILLVCRR